MKIKSVFAGTFVLLGLPLAALAQNVMSGVAMTDVEKPLDDGTKGSAYLLGESSYSCMMRMQGSVGIRDVEGPSGDTPQYKMTGNYWPPAQSLKQGDGTAYDLDMRENRIAFFAEETGTYEFTFEADMAYPNPYGLWCIDTTLTGSFNTFVNDYNYLELTNQTPNTINIKWYARSYDGSTVKDDLELPAGARVDIDLHSPVGPNKFGQVKVLSDSVYGGLVAAISQYKVTSEGPRLETSERLHGRAMMGQ